MSFPYLPNELIHKVLEYDGRICYKNHRYQINVDNKMFSCIKHNISSKHFILKSLPFSCRILNSVKKIGVEMNENFKGFEDFEFLDELDYPSFQYIMRLFKEDGNKVWRDIGIQSFYPQFIFTSSF